MQNVVRPTWAEIDLDNLAFNFQSVKNFVGSNIKYMAVVKADAYGHGAVECAKRLEKEGVDWFGVALPKEGIQLRNAGIRKRILCLGGFWKGQETELFDYNITPVIYRVEQAELFDRAAKKRGSTVEIHIKVDTGMNRIGVRFDEVERFAEYLKKFSNLHVEGVMTHFASADNLDETEFTDLQKKRFDDALVVFERAGFHPVYKDLANSAGSIVHPNSKGNMVRLGGVLWGFKEDVLPQGIKTPILKPVLSLHTKIASLKTVPAGETLGYGRTFKTEKEMRIATIPIGYQDGFRRDLSNKGSVIVNGEYASVVGRVSMDWTILDVSHIEGVAVDDRVVLIGEDSGKHITAEDVARTANTISYEITCGINRRVTKSFSGS